MGFDLVAVRAGAGAARRARALALVLLFLLMLLLFLVLLVFLATVVNKSVMRTPNYAVTEETHSLLVAMFMPTAPNTAPPAVPRIPWPSLLPMKPPAAPPSSVDPRPLSPSGPVTPG